MELTKKTRVEIQRHMPKKGERLESYTIASIENLAHATVAFGPNKWAGVQLHRLIQHIRYMEGCHE